MRLMTQMLKHAPSRGEVMSPQPTKTVSVQIKLDLRRPGTFNYPKYHQRRCHDLTSARINGALTKSLTRRVNRARRLSVSERQRQTLFFIAVWAWAHATDMMISLQNNRMMKKNVGGGFLHLVPKFLMKAAALFPPKWRGTTFVTTCHYFMSFFFFFFSQSGQNP